MGSGYCMLYNMHLHVTEFICYDDGCHLRKYAYNPIRKSVSTTAALLSNMEIVFDKMHMAGHVDKWCKENCDPKKFTELKDVCYLVNTIRLTLMDIQEYLVCYTTYIQS